MMFSLILPRLYDWAVALFLTIGLFLSGMHYAAQGGALLPALF